MAVEGFRNDLSRAGNVGDETEYGGNPRTPGKGTTPQRLPGGASISLSASESARVLRQTGIIGNTLPAAVDAATAVAGLEPGTLEYAQEVERQQARIELEKRTNGYWKEIDSDDNIS